MKEKLYGVFPALLTPFNEKGNVDKKRLKKLVKFLILKGIDGVYICGSTGEGLLMSVEERKMVAEIVKEIAENKVKIISHIGCLNTKDTVELAKHSEKIKIDGISSIPPIYFRYRFEEIYNYYKNIAEATSLPFLIYYIPSTTGIVLSNDKIAEFSKIKNIIGLKYTDTDFYLLQDLLFKVKGKWIAFSGSDQMFLPGLIMGTVGCIGSTQNVLPEIFVDIYRNFKEGNIKKAMELQKRITIAVSLLKRYGGLYAWKTAMKFRGIDCGFCRSPIKEKLNNEEEKLLKKEWGKNFPEFSEGVSNEKN